VGQPDRLDEAFLFAQSIDIDTYDRHKDNCANSSRCCRSTDIPANSKSST
jgi:hypothetical protein